MKIAFITGLSTWGNHSLSPEQTSFLNSLQTEENNKIYCNFPYTNNVKKYKHTNVVLASFSNALQYFLSRTKWIENKSTQLKHIIKENDKVLLLAGSCGLELLNNIKFSKEEKEKIHIIAYGAVARKIPDFQYLTLIQGKKDFIARIWIHIYDIKIEGHHMNYLESKEFLDFVNSYVEKMENAK